jgi:hypothetical protein
MTTNSEYQHLSASAKKQEDWMNSKWRPMMGWMYMVLCMFDFMIAPILWSMIQAYQGGQVNIQWQPLTLQGAGLFHVAMGAVLGLAAWGRTQEKMSGTNIGTSYVAPPPNPGMMQPGMMQPMQPVQTTVMQTYGAPPSNTGSNVVYKNGKAAPIQPEFPEI